MAAFIPGHLLSTLHQFLVHAPTSPLSRLAQRQGESGPADLDGAAFRPLGQSREQRYDRMALGDVRLRRLSDAYRHFRTCGVCAISPETADSIKSKLARGTLPRPFYLLVLEVDVLFFIGRELLEHILRHAIVHQNALAVCPKDTSGHIFLPPRERRAYSRALARSSLTRSSMA